MCAGPFLGVLFFVVDAPAHTGFLIRCPLQAFSSSESPSSLHLQLTGKERGAESPNFCAVLGFEGG